VVQPAVSDTVITTASCLQMNGFRSTRVASGCSEWLDDTVAHLEVKLPERDGRDGERWMSAQWLASVQRTELIHTHAVCCDQCMHDAYRSNSAASPWGPMAMHDNVWPAA
jgi:hypothetical protein